MNLQKAKAKALILAAERKIDHVLYNMNGSIEVAMKNQYDGEIIETVSYEKPIEKPIKKNKTENKQEEVQDLPELRDASSSEVLPRDGNR